MRAWLAPSEPRCRPSQPCMRSNTCGRAIAPIPAAGAIVQDYSLTPLPGGACLGYLAESACVPPPAAARETKTWPTGGGGA